MDRRIVSVLATLVAGADSQSRMVLNGLDRATGGQARPGSPPRGQLAFPERKPSPCAGDDGITMLALGDLLTEVQRMMPGIHIVLNNSMLEFFNIEQEQAGLIPFGTTLENPGFARVAEAMGARGIRVEEPGDLRSALESALSRADGPAVVAVLVGKYALALPAHVPLTRPADLPLVWPGRY